MKTHFTAGEVGLAVGVDADTLRLWRTRYACTIGERKGQGHWQYTFADAVKLAIAYSLQRFGVHIEVALQTVEDADAVVDAINRAVVDLDRSTVILGLAAGVGISGGWNSPIVSSAEQGMSSEGMLSLQWASHDILLDMENFLAEQIWQINVSRIAWRVNRIFTLAE